MLYFSYHDGIVHYSVIISIRKPNMKINFRRFRLLFRIIFFGSEHSDRIPIYSGEKSFSLCIHFNDIESAARSLTLYE